MRVVLVHRYFWPDTPPYAHILKQIALCLGEAGHEVTVLTCQPSYDHPRVRHAPARELIAPGVEVRRWRVLPDRRHSVVKGINLVIFGARLMLAGSRLGPVDVVMAASTPPIAIAKVGSWLARRLGARFVYHKQDIYPEVVLASGALRDGRLASLLRWMDCRTDQAADRIVVLSEDMAKTIERRGVAVNRISVINNFDPWLPTRSVANSKVLPLSSRRARSDGRLQVAFTGHLGRFQNLGILIVVAGLLRDDARIQFNIFGDGPMRIHLESEARKHDLHNVTLHGHTTPDTVAAFLRSDASVGIVSLLPGVIRTSYPSKTMSYLRSGCPVLVLVESESELARTVTAAGAGVHANPNAPDIIAATLRHLADKPAVLIDAGERAEKLYSANFSADCQTSRWLRLFEDLK